MSANDYALLRLIRKIVRDEMAPLSAAVTNGTVATIEGNSASVFLAGSDAATPGFTIPPTLELEAGDLVSVYRVGAYQQITNVLNRNALALPDTEAVAPSTQKQLDYPDSIAGAADYLARMKRTADTLYRLNIGLDASDRAQILLGQGSVVDLRAYRTTAKTLVVDDTAGGPVTLNVLGSLQDDGVNVAVVGHAHTAAFDGAIVSRATTQSIPSNANTAALYTTNDRITLASYHSTSSNTERLVAAGGTGYYAVSAYIALASMSPASRTVLFLRETGVTTLAVQRGDPSTTGVPSLSLSADVYLAANDWVDFAVYHNQGTALNLTAARATIRWLGT